MPEKYYCNFSVSLQWIMDRRQSVWNTLNLETAKLHASNSDLTSGNRQKSSRRKKHTTVSTEETIIRFIIHPALTSKNKNYAIFQHRSGPAMIKIKTDRFSPCFQLTSAVTYEFPFFMVHGISIFH